LLEKTIENDAQLNLINVAQKHSSYLLRRDDLKRPRIRITQSFFEMIYVTREAQNDM